MKVIQKYFLAIVPDGFLQEKCTEIKNELREQFNVKYALKSPAHVTLKMPFSYNEAKEQKLIESLQNFLIHYHAFSIRIGGVDTFGKRVIFLKIKHDDRLLKLQNELKLLCKRELNLIDELSDRNFHPHMTIAFKDLKEIQVEKILNLVKARPVQEEYYVDNIHLLKRINGRWISISKLNLNLTLLKK